jgi:hypothetical protein
LSRSTYLEVGLENILKKNSTSLKLNGTVVLVLLSFHVGWVGIWFVRIFDWSLWQREIIETVSEGESLIARSDTI